MEGIWAKILGGIASSLTKLFERPLFLLIITLWAALHSYLNPEDLKKCLQA